MAPAPAIETRAARGGLPDLLTIREVAEIARVHSLTVRRQIAAGNLKSLRFGVQIRVARTELDRFLSGQAR
jgi:excisionase family DNA binding protein